MFLILLITLQSFQWQLRAVSVVVAYLLIGRLYQSSVNNCGSNEFEKRMVYAAALRQAQKASSVDPSISTTARKYINSYRANLPSKKIIFTAGIAPGSSYKINCWIGETVRVPN